MDLLSVIAKLIAFVLAFLVLIIVVIVAQFFAPKKSIDGAGEINLPEVEKEEKPKSFKKHTHLWEKYPPIETFEFLYWQGVYETWRYNVFAPDIIKYAKENLPLRHLEFTVYNSNKNSQDYTNFKRRIESLRKHKTINFPLAVINYDREYLSIESTSDFEYIKARIDAEWDRYYGLV